MAKKETGFEYSPWQVHEDLLKRIKQELAFDGGDVAPWQRKLRRKLKQCLGEMPDNRPPLKPRTLWKKDHELGTIEKVVFTSERHADVPAYFSLPRIGRPPYPVMICLQGHSGGMYNDIAVDPEDESTAIDVPGHREFTLHALSRGFAALAIEQRAFGERRETYNTRLDPACWDASMHAIMLGRTLAGERTWDVDRGIDYLETRPEIDRKRIGCMGNSGGGTVTMYAAALLPRLAFAMPSCSFCTFRDSVLGIKHCMDNHIPGLYKYAEMADVMGLFAPKPLVVVAGVEDTIFPIDGVRKAFRDLRRVYKAAGVPKACRLVEGPEGHRFYADLAWPVLLELLGLEDPAA